MSATTYIGEKLGSRSSGIGEQRMRWYQATYLVRSNRGSVSADTIRATPGLPQYGTRHPFYSRAFVTAVEPREIPESGAEWEVSVRWESRPWEREEDQQNIPPWEQPAKVRRGSVPVEFSRRADLDGKPFVNAASDPFIPPPHIPTSNLSIEIQRAELEHDDIEVMKWFNVVNHDAWWGFPRYAVRLGPIAVDDAVWDFQSYYVKTYVLEVKAGCFDDPPDLWIPLRILNEGSRELVWDGHNQEFVRRYIEDDDGVQSTEPTLLNADGTQMTRAQVAADGPVYLEFRTFEARPFSELFPEV